MRIAIEAATVLEPDDTDVVALKAAWVARYEHALDLAERLYLDALDRNPRPVVSTSYAWLCTLTGRFEEAQRLFEKAHAADPFGFWHRHNLGSLAYFRRDYPTAEKILREALEIEPDHACVRLLLGRVLMHSGRGTEAIAETDWCRAALKGMTGVELFHISALASAGERRAAQDALRDFERNSAGRYTSCAYRAMAHAALDETDQALEWLARGLAERDYWMLNIGIDPAYDSLRPRTEFISILRAIGLPS
jgi:tetratricopeptide (TPR) repeat protein